MSWILNRYYPIHKAGEEPKKLAESLLQAYSLTRVAYDVLGEEMLQKISFGFIGEGEQIIQQGEKGKDLFLICHSPVQVLVDEKVVVTMDAPVLLGDKALIWPDSTRAATIQVPQGLNALVLKVPMGLFLRDFTFAEIPDGSFKREQDIYSGLFQEIQKRLFEYIPLQQNQYEAVRSSIIGMNTKFISLSLERGDDQDWPKEVWETLPNFLSSKFGFKTDKEINIGNFKSLLQPYFEGKYPRSAFQCSDAEFLAKRHQLWEFWMTQAAALIIKYIPDDKLSFTIKGLQLFSPQNYRGMIEGLLSKVEAYFPPGSPATTKGNFTGFFSGGEHSNDFALAKFQKHLAQDFLVKYPHRITGMMAQAAARVAAECENEFNKALAKMKDFDESTRSLVHGEEKKEKSLSPKVFEAHLEQISRGFNNFNKSIAGAVENVPGGEHHYVQKTCPLISELVYHASTKQVKEAIENSFFEVINYLNLPADPLSKEELQGRLRLVKVMPGYIIPSDQLAEHFWIPLSPGMQLKRADVMIQSLSPGEFIGGQGWSEEEGCPPEDLLYIQTPERDKEGLVDQGLLLLVIPDAKLKEFDKAGGEHEETSLHWMEWTKGKLLQEMDLLAKQRNDLLDRCMGMEESHKLDGWIQDFESGVEPLEKGDEEKVLEFLKGSVSYEPTAEGMPAQKLANELYENLIAQYLMEHPNVSDEESRNSCYTQFRFLLSEITRILHFNDDEKEEELNDDTEYSAIWPLVQLEIINILSEKGIDKPANHVRLEGEGMILEMEPLLAQFDKFKEKIQIYRASVGIVEEQLLLARRQRRRLEERYSIVASGETGESAEQLQKKFIQDQVVKLLKILRADLDVNAKPEDHPEPEELDEIESPDMEPEDLADVGEIEPLDMEPEEFADLGEVEPLDMEPEEFGDLGEVEPLDDAFASALGFLRRRLAKDLTVRRVPELRFELDETSSRAREMDQLISDATGKSASADQIDDIDDSDEQE